MAQELTGIKDDPLFYKTQNYTHVTADHDDTNFSKLLESETG